MGSKDDMFKNQQVFCFSYKEIIHLVNDAFSFSPIHVFAFLFQYPLSFFVVDPEDAPDYYSIIKSPMDFGTIKKKLEVSCYALS